MNKIIEIDLHESALVYGGRSDFMGRFLEGLSEYVGSFAKICYLANKMRHRTLCVQLESGDQTIWK